MATILRVIWRLFAFVWTIGEGVFDFLRLVATERGSPSRVTRAFWLHRWSRALLRRWEVTAEATGAMPVPGLVVSNHLGYLDVLAFSALGPCVFVSKAEVNRWPLFGMLARTGGTIFVDRKRARSARIAAREVQDALQQEITVVLFPEGTSSDGTAVLPFRSSLFGASIQVRQPIHPARISYSAPGGSVERDVCYWANMTFGPHFLKLLSLPHIAAFIQFGRSVHSQNDRKVAARLAHEAVVELAEAHRLFRPRPQYDGQLPRRLEIRD